MRISRTCTENLAHYKQGNVGYTILSPQYCAPGNITLTKACIGLGDIDITHADMHCIYNSSTIL